MAKLDMRKALAGAVAPLETDMPARESSTPELHLVDAETEASQLGSAPNDVVAEEVPGEPASRPEAATHAPRRQPARKTTVAKPAPRPEPSPASTATAMGVHVDASLDARLVAYRAATRLSYHQIILNAVEDTYPRLAELVSKALGREEAPAPKVRLFERSFVPAPVVLEGKQERVIHTIRITISNRSMLDDISAEVKAPSRNFMVCVALDAYLPA